MSQFCMIYLDKFEEKSEKNISDKYFSIKIHPNSKQTICSSKLGLMGQSFNLKS